MSDKEIMQAVAPDFFVASLKALLLSNDFTNINIQISGTKKAAENKESVAEHAKQQLKPNMPTLAEVQNAFVLDIEDTGSPTMDEQAAIKFAYNYISRHIGH